MKGSLFLAIVLVLSTIYSIGAAVEQAPLVLTDADSRVVVLENLRVIEDIDLRWTIDDPEGLWQEAFTQAVPIDSPVLNGPSGRHWAMVDIENNSSEYRWVLSFHLPSVDTLATVLEPAAGGTPIIKQTGRAHDARSRDYPVIGHHTGLTLEPGESYRLAILFEHSAPPPPNLMELELQTHDAFVAQSFRLHTGLLLCLGVMLALGIYMFFMWVRLREMAHLWFAAYAISTALIWITHYELLRFLFFPERTSALTNYLATAAMVASILLFTQLFLRLPEVAPRLAMVFSGTIAATIGLMGLLPFLDTRAIAYYLNASFAASALLLLTIAAIVALRARVPSARLFSLACAVIVGGALLTVLDALFLSLPTATVRLVTVVTTAGGVVIMALSVADQIHGLRIGLSRAQKGARTDPLTGLGNRAAFDEALASMTRRFQDEELADLAIVYADLDGLKSINDTLGHHVGDQVLCSFAVALNKRFRDHDRVCRIGGDEFVILMPLPNPMEPLDWLPGRFDDIMEELRNAEFEGFGVSIGVSYLSEADGDPRGALQLADERMYAAKEGAAPSTLPEQSR